MVGSGRIVTRDDEKEGVGKVVGAQRGIVWPRA
jgi:hypothetical protein